MKRIPNFKIQLVRDGSSLYNTNTISCPEDAAEIAAAHFEELATDREVFAVLFLNTKNKVIGIHDVSVGSLTASVVHPREVFKAACLANAASIILTHNHPSGDPAPSKEDINITARLVQAGRLMDIPVLDHIIIGDGTGRSMSFKANDLIKD